MVNNTADLNPATDAVGKLAEQIERLSLGEQVCLLQRLAHAIEQKVALPCPGSVQTSPTEQPAQPVLSRPSATPALTPKLQSITYRIIGCALAVHRRLGRGLREDNYQRALEAQFIHAGLVCRPQQQFAIYDELEHHPGGLGKLLGYYIPDFVIEDQVIVEIKALAQTNDSHLAQVIGYLVVSNCPVGLLINFGERSLHPRRILRPSRSQPQHINTQWLWNPSQAAT